MRVLYISGGQGPDYLCDMLFHGLRSELGDGALDASRLWYMYADEFAHGKHDRATLYGRGFSVYGLLGPDTGVDRDDIENKIRSRFFDLVIYGSIHRCADFIREVMLAYPAEKIAFIDGEDQTAIVPALIGHGFYFKRELASPMEYVWPISFAIPDERIGTAPRQKVKLQALIDPRDKRTYIHQTEAGYYGDYSESLFGVTMKKAGWDCLRHYEIMANACVPWFLGLESCPTSSMTTLPKCELLAAKNLLETRGPEFFETCEGAEIWLKLQQQIDAAMRKDCTTRALAQYVLQTVGTLHAEGRPDRKGRRLL
ncbi:MAG: hypothetical protein ACRD3L_05930 [Terriglobales bacterium]